MPLSNSVINDMSHILAKIDGRPAHTEDYTPHIIKLLKKVSYDILLRRMTYLHQNPKIYPGGFTSVCDFLETGELRDEYTGELILIFDDNT